MGGSMTRSSQQNEHAKWNSQIIRRHWKKSLFPAPVSQPFGPPSSSWDALRDSVHKTLWMHKNSGEFSNFGNDSQFLNNLLQLMKGQKCEEISEELIKNQQQFLLIAKAGAWNKTAHHKWLLTKSENAMGKNTLWMNLHSVKVNKKANASRRVKKDTTSSCMVTAGHVFVRGEAASRVPERHSCLPWAKKWDLPSTLTKQKGLLGQLVSKNEKIKNQQTALSYARLTAFANGAQS